MVLLDIIMPKKNGLDAFPEIKSLCPGMKCLFMSGYTRDVIGQKGLLENGAEILLKPMPPWELARKVREILDA